MSYTLYLLMLFFLSLHNKQAGYNNKCHSGSISCTRFHFSSLLRERERELSLFAGNISLHAIESEDEEEKKREREMCVHICLSLLHLLTPIPYRFSNWSCASHRCTCIRCVWVRSGKYTLKYTSVLILSPALFNGTFCVLLFLRR